MTIDRGKVTSEPPDLAVELLKKVSNTDNHIRNWLDCIRNRQKPNGDVEIGHRSATVCHLGNIARWAGRKLQWDPVKETFVGDDEANRYLDRTRRKGYELPENDLECGNSHYRFSSRGRLCHGVR